MRVVTLLSDFGAIDPYVGIMKGVMLSIEPHLQLVDLTHAIPPQDVARGARALEVSWPWFPEGSLHLAVVDPGVGSARRGLVVSAAGRLFVGPDNGILTSALRQPGARCYALEQGRYRLPRLSATFHGRDVFAPAVGWLARGVPASELGEAVPEPVLLPVSSPRPNLRGGLDAEVEGVDVFGNVITNVSGEVAREHFHSGGWLEIGGQRLDRLHRTYSDAAPGALLALIGSSDRLEISINGGSAADLLRAGAGSHVVLGRG